MKLSQEEISQGTLSEESRRTAVTQLKVLGYTILESVFPAEEVQSLRKRFLEVLEGYAARTDPNRGASRYGMPLPFEAPFTAPEIVSNRFALDVIREILGPDVICSYFASDTPLPGSDYQHAHSDAIPLFPEDGVTLPPFAYVVNLPLVDFRDNNGPLEIWPYGTHLIADADLIPIAEFDHIQERRESALGRLAEEMGPVPLLAPAGSLIIRDIRMWHRGTPNRSAEPRPMVALVYNRPWYHHGVIQMPQGAFDSLAPAAREVFRTAVVQ
jgi:Phytanoyl-CoA dioxygenase (PhyH)